MQIAPLISSSSAGPLGVLHLPRLWLKILLHARGVLPEGYRFGSGGFDERLCTNLGIDRDAFVRYIETELPDYQKLEAWVRQHATGLTPENVAAHNKYVRSGNIGEERARESRERFGIADQRFSNAIALNDLDDWAAAHAEVVALPAS